MKTSLTEFSFRKVMNFALVPCVKQKSKRNIMQLFYSRLWVDYSDVWAVRGIFRILSAIYDNTFREKSYLYLAVNYFCEKVHLST